MTHRDKQYVRDVLLALKKCVAEKHKWDNEDQKYFNKAMRLIKVKRIKKQTKE